MSAVEYTRCDNPECGRVTPDEPGDCYTAGEGWLHIAWRGECLDFCPDCAKKMLESVGVGEN